MLLKQRLHSYNDDSVTLGQIWKTQPALWNNALNRGSNVVEMHVLPCRCSFTCWWHPISRRNRNNGTLDHTTWALTVLNARHKLLECFAYKCGKWTSLIKLRTFQRICRKYRNAAPRKAESDLNGYEEMAACMRPKLQVTQAEPRSDTAIY